MANGIPLSIAQLPPLSSALSGSLIPVTQNGTTGSMTLAVLLGGPYAPAVSLAGTENVLLNQSGTLVGANLSQLISLSSTIGAIAGTESLVLTPSAGAIKKVTVGGLITSAAASSAIAGTEVFGNVGAAYQKTTVAQLLTQATVAGNAAPADLVPTTQGGLWRASSITQLTAGSILYTAGGTANAQTIAPSPAFGSLRAGMVFAFLPVAKNTGAATLAVNAIGAVNIFAYGAALLGGELPTLAVVQYDGTQFNLLNPDDSFGTTPITLTGMSSGGTGNINWRIVKNHVVYLLTSVGITGTSNAATMTMTLAAFLSASATQNFNACSLQDNGGNLGQGLFNIAGTAVTFGKIAPTGGGFTVSGGKGLSAGFGVNYVI